jgi:hypothetical protein
MRRRTMLSPGLSVDTSLAPSSALGGEDGGCLRWGPGARRRLGQGLEDFIFVQGTLARWTRSRQIASGDFFTFWPSPFAVRRAAPETLI